MPDVSADADPQTGYLVYWNGSWTVLGGTSGSAPLWAALVALTDAWPGCSAHPVGFLNPSLYLIAGAGASASALNDVTRGDNNVFGPGLYPATVGYDLATGLGTPDAANPLGRGLVSQLCALPKSGGSPYASPTTSSLKVLRPAVKANGTAFSVVKVTLRDRLRFPGAGQASHPGQHGDDADEDHADLGDHERQRRRKLRRPGHRCSEGQVPCDGPDRRCRSAGNRHGQLPEAMRGVILAGGTGSRLFPLTRITNKHLLPIYDRPMISYGIEALVKAGVTEIMVVTGGTHAGEFLRLLSNGHEFGVERLLYAYQERPAGSPRRWGSRSSSSATTPSLVMLADNIFGRSFAASVERFGEQRQGRPHRCSPRSRTRAHLRHLGVPELDETRQGSSASSRSRRTRRATTASRASTSTTPASST